MSLKRISIDLRARRLTAKICARAWIVPAAALAALAVGLFSNASIAQTVTNDLSATSSNNYRVSGDDPYVIFNPRQQAENTRYLSIDLGSHLTGAPLEIFFNSQQDLFNPYYKISFTIPSFPALLELPTDIDFSQSTRLRLDINQCQDCPVNLQSLPFLSNQVSASATVVQPSRVQNGVTPLASGSTPLDTNDWQLNDLNGEPNNFEISASDPFLVSPQLILSTQQLAGVYFKLKVPRSDQAWNDYQLFYQTEHHTFSAQASSTVRVADSFNRVADSANGVVEFMFPLGFLSNEQQSGAVLERIRLDIPEISGNWALLEARLVHQEQLDDYLDMIPTQLVEMKQQRATGLSLIKKSLFNVFADIGFSISYLLLLILTAWFLVRAYRSSR
ncbi:MAG: hypothetical protein ACJAYF_003313 [Arenicella sp.]|jgi:hypothetical protein